MKNQSINLLQRISYGLIISSILMAAFCKDNLPVAYAQQSVTNAHVSRAEESRSQFIERQKDSSTVYDFSLVPVDAHQSLYDAILSRPAGLLEGGTYFTVGVYYQENDWGIGYLAAAVNNIPPNWATGIWFILHKENSWTAFLEKTTKYDELFQKLPNAFQKRMIPNTADVQGGEAQTPESYLFPWDKSQQWQYTQSWHQGNALDFAPSNVSPGNMWAISASSGKATLYCSDNYQAFVRVTTGPDIFTYYHIDFNSFISQNITDRSISQGQTLGLLYDGIQGAGWYDLSQQWPWPPCTQGSSPSCQHLQYKTMCGGGTAAHLHWELPSQSVVVDGWQVDTNGVWTNGGQPKSVNSLFSSTNRMIRSFNDEFNNPTLDPRWQWNSEDPNRWSLITSPGNLRIVATHGDLWESCNNTQNLLLQDAPSGNFEISTKVSFYPTANYQQGGLLIFVDDDNYIKLDALYADTPGKAQNVEFIQEQQGVTPPGGNWPWVSISLNKPIFLKIRKWGNVYTGLYSADGQLWNILGTVAASSTIVNPRAGLYAFAGNPNGTPSGCSAPSAPDIAVDFDFFHVATVQHTRGADTTGVFRPSNGALYLKNTNATGFADVQINYGVAGDYPVVGDWDGNGTATIGIYRFGSFYLRNSNTIGYADIVFPFGALGDKPIAGDWDGDGVDTIGVYRSSTGTFYLRNHNSSGAPEMSFALGFPGDVGIAGDWNNDGFDTTGVFRPSNGALYLKNTNNTGFADIQINYGLPGDFPVVGDWDGDGDSTIGIYRNGSFYLRNSNTIGFADIVFALGVPGDMPIAGDWDGIP